MESEFYLKDGRKKKKTRTTILPLLKSEGMAWITQNELMTTEK